MGIYWESFNNNLWFGMFQRILIFFTQFPNINICLKLRNKLYLPLGRGIAQRGSEGGSREVERCWGCMGGRAEVVLWCHSPKRQRGSGEGRARGSRSGFSFRGVWGRVGGWGGEERARKNWENRRERRKQKRALSRDQENPLVWPFFECLGLEDCAAVAPGAPSDWRDKNQRDVRMAFSPTGRGCVCTHSFSWGQWIPSGRGDGGFTGPQVSNRQVLQTVGTCCDVYSPVLVETPKDALRRKERLNVGLERGLLHQCLTGYT